jgi:Uma2 family endonuclease
MPRELEETNAFPSNQPRPPLPADYYGSIADLVIQDDTPVDNFIAEKEQRLLTEPLYTTWRGGKHRRPFIVAAYVGLFFRPKIPPLVPDAMLAMDVVGEIDPARKETLTYLIWTRGKPPDVVVEIVSDRLGGEETHKFKTYAKWGVPYYVIFDPYEVLRHGLLRAFVARNNRYVPLEPPYWFEPVGLGLRLWEGEYEGHTDRYLRWCDARGRVILTGKEKADLEREKLRKQRQRADQERQRADQERQRADQERQRADQERQRADQERRQREQLEARLRELGIDPSS